MGGATKTVEGDEAETAITEQQVGSLKPGSAGKWASCIHLVDGASGDPVSVLELGGNEAAFSICTCTFHDRGGEAFVCVGTGKDLTLRPRKLTCGYIHVYRLIRGAGGVATSGGLVLLHKTEVKEVPYAMCAFNGRLLVGIGNTLRIYDLGKLKLLRKCECRGLPVLVTSVCTKGDRVYASDLSNGLVYLKYKRTTNELVIFADDIVPRFMTQALHLDYDTMLGADKFGNIFASRLPDKCDDDVHNPTGNRILWSTGYLNSAKKQVGDGRKLPLRGAHHCTPEDAAGTRWSGACASGRDHGRYPRDDAAVNSRGCRFPCTLGNVHAGRASLFGRSRSALLSVGIHACQGCCRRRLVRVLRNSPARPPEDDLDRNGQDGRRDSEETRNIAQSNPLSTAPLVYSNCLEAPAATIAFRRESL